MPRNKRWSAVDVTQLVALRGHDGSSIVHAETDYQHLIGCLAEATDLAACEVHAFAFAGSELRLLCTPREPYAVGRLVQAIGRTYVPWFNRCYGRVGALWDGRYRAAAVEPSSALLLACPYVERFPIACGLTLDDRSWTSLRRRGELAVRSLVTPLPGFQALGDTAAARCKAYRALCERALAPSPQRALERALRHGLAVGSEAFRRQLTARCGARSELGRPGRPRSPAPAAGIAATAPMASAVGCQVT